MNQEMFQSRSRDLVADVRLYDADQDGRRQAIPAEVAFGCLCFLSKSISKGGWDARLQIGNEPFSPGTSRQIGFVFLTPAGADAIKQAGHFYLWDGRFIGEASVIS
ncbi:hypothetical protein [Sphingomonas sp. LaA6.9]|uniref:hypothetical protein n=1 Tax=Sphingomonas sp. LaA6.9 TaxID=2919914 RepID=UPI001F4F47BF|nr:hypothetical protein [Sphingomonas sp. LaA6.9]MCJ8157934.1 hypothetical protein [Sphingomonas sp. LaA6.9]